MSDDERESVGRSSPPVVPPDSPGSSVSTRMQEEYSELLRLTVAGGLVDSFTHQENAATAEIEEMFNSASSLEPKSNDEQENNGAVPAQPPTAIFADDVSANKNSNSIYMDMSDKDSTPSASDPRIVNIGSQPQFQRSNRSQQSSPTPAMSRVTVGPDINELGRKLESWLGNLKGDILSEMTQAVLKSQDKQKEYHQQEIRDLITDKQRIEREATRLGELVAASEMSLNRKDTLVNNLSQALATSKDKIQVAKVFYNQRGVVEDSKRMSFTEKIAKKHHERQLIEKVMRSWFGLIQTRWRNRVQKSCEEHARGVCSQLTQDYEDKIKCLNTMIDSLEQKVFFLQQERGQYAEQVRKAFMRGVCALNMETMSAFGQDDNVDLDPGTGHSRPKTSTTGPAEYQPDSLEEGNYSNNANLYIQSVGSKGYDSDDREVGKGGDPQAHNQSQTRVIPAAEVSYTTGVIESGTVGVAGRSAGVLATHKPKSKSAKLKNRPASASGSAPIRHNARQVGGVNQGQPLAPPMASIVVERHNPVTKQTVGKATAMRYPKSAMGQVSKSQPSLVLGQTFRPLAGQTASLTTISSSIKVVD